MGSVEAMLDKLGPDGFRVAWVFFLAASLALVIVIGLTIVLTIDRRQPRGDTTAWNYFLKQSWIVASVLVRGGIGLILAAAGTALYLLGRHAIGLGIHFSHGLLWGLFLLFIVLVPRHLSLRQFNELWRVLAKLSKMDKLLAEDAAREVQSFPDPTTKDR